MEQTDVFVVTITVTNNKNELYNGKNMLIFLDREKAIKFIMDNYKDHIAGGVKDHYNHDTEEWECEIAKVVYDNDTTVTWHLTQYGYYKKGAFIPMNEIQEIFEDMVADEAILDEKSLYL